MGIGIFEIAFLFLVALVTALTVKATKQRWLAVVPVFFLIATIVSPADLFSTLLIGVPNCALFALGLKYFAGDSSRHAGRTA